MSEPLSWWLARLEQMQPERIELGLQRIRRVAQRCNLDKPDFKIVTVAGTNGKGSTVAYIASMLKHSGYSVGAYTSPHFVDFNERIVVNGKRADEQSLCEAFSFIESRRGDTELTYFEFTTLAGMYIFQRAAIDVAVLEVGLGGRLDAVNVWDGDVACITSIGIDHVDWLGDDRESIGSEKAGVARSGCALICGERDLPHSIVTAANEIGAKLLKIAQDFRAEASGGGLSFSSPYGSAELPVPQIKGDWVAGNIAVAICACAEILGRIPAQNALNAAMKTVVIPGRMQQVSYRGVPVLFDVAHNAQAAGLLARHLRETAAPTRAVFACLRDKDAQAVVQQLAGVVDAWHVANLQHSRAMSAAELVGIINTGGQIPAEVFTSVILAFESAVAQSDSNSRVIVFGSFHVVGPVLEFLASEELTNVASTS